MQCSALEERSVADARDALAKGNVGTGMLLIDGVNHAFVGVFIDAIDCFHYGAARSAARDRIDPSD